MEEKLNIANILKDKPISTKLYADAFGELSLECVNLSKDNSIYVKTKTFNCCSFYSDGKYTKEGEPILVPSKEMRDWSKFAWKKGDVLVSDDGCIEVIFDKWYDDTYTSFYCKHYLNSENKNKIVYYEEFLCTTARYSLEDRDAAQTYINTIEERLGGKLNRETLKIEKKPDFKDGDVIFVRCKRFCYIEIFNYFKDDELYDYASLSTTLQMIDICGKYPISKDEIVEIRIATDSEKKQLFEALAKENKVWNAEKKQVVDLKIKWMDLKPFDKVLSRRCSKDYWVLNFYSHKTDYYHICIDGSSNLYCIPYNEETAHLLGTTDEWKGSEQ